MNDAVSLLLTDQFLNDIYMTFFLFLRMNEKTQKVDMSTEKIHSIKRSVMEKD